MVDKYRVGKLQFVYQVVEIEEKTEEVSDQVVKFKESVEVKEELVEIEKKAVKASWSSGVGCGDK